VMRSEDAHLYDEEARLRPGECGPLALEGLVHAAPHESASIREKKV
jgi:hypothetical protein